MRTLLILLTLAVAALAAPGYESIFTNYHKEIGIPEAARIKALEEAIDFDGARIIGGTHSSVGQFPFFAGVIVHLRWNIESVCGCSLLSNERALTAAHCWRHRGIQADAFELVLGSVRLHSGGLRIWTDRVELHAHYNDHNLNNDIAIIRFDAIGFNNNIQPINIASGPNSYEGAYAYAVGFGAKDDETFLIPRNQPLSHVSLPVMSNVDCSRIFSADVVIHSTLCTSGANRKGTCHGDSGGPLAITRKPALLIAVTSFGPTRGCTLSLPSGYVRVSSFASWIRARM